MFFHVDNPTVVLAKMKFASVSENFLPTKQRLGPIYT